MRVVIYKYMNDFHLCTLYIFLFPLLNFSHLFFPFPLIASRRLENAEALAKKYPGTVAKSFDITSEQEIEALVAEHDIVIR